MQKNRKSVGESPIQKMFSSTELSAPDSTETLEKIDAALSEKEASVNRGGSRLQCGVCHAMEGAFDWTDDCYNYARWKFSFDA